MIKKRGLKILIMGLPTSGKTTLARALHRALNETWFCVHYNADEVRASINYRLKFSADDRKHQAFTMGWLADRICEQGGIAICDFVCPTNETRQAFAQGSREHFTIFVDRLSESPYDDTNRVFEPPHFFDYRVHEGTTVDDTVQHIIREMVLRKHLHQSRF